MLRPSGPPVRHNSTPFQWRKPASGAGGQISVRPGVTPPRREHAGVRRDRPWPFLATARTVASTVCMSLSQTSARSGTRIAAVHLMIADGPGVTRLAGRKGPCPSHSLGTHTIRHQDTGIPVRQPTLESRTCNRPAAGQLMPRRTVCRHSVTDPVPSASLAENSLEDPGREETGTGPPRTVRALASCANSDRHLGALAVALNWPFGQHATSRTEGRTGRIPASR